MLTVINIYNVFYCLYIECKINISIYLKPRFILEFVNTVMTMSKISMFPFHSDMASRRKNLVYIGTWSHYFNDKVFLSHESTAPVS